MPRNKKAQHFHKYEKFTWPNGRPYYKCMLPGCPHLLTLADHLIGRESLCWGPECNKLVTVTREDVQRGLRHPMCEGCKNERLERREALSNIG